MLHVPESHSKDSVLRIIIVCAGKRDCQETDAKTGGGA